MDKPKAYKEQEPMQQKAREPMISTNVVMESRDDLKSAISDEELLNRLHPRIKSFAQMKVIFAPEVEEDLYEFI